MALRDDPRYVGLARRAAGRLGSSSDPIVNAILAQWTCELGNGDAWPPRRNNPGNLSAGAAKTIGARYSVDPGSNPQPGNPIVTFPSPEAGADAYAKLLGSSGRYSGVRAAVRARDGRAYIEAIGASGYGGSLACMRNVLGGSAAPGRGASFGGPGLPAASGPAGLPGGISLVGAPFINIPEGKTLTTSDIDSVILPALGTIGGGDPLGITAGRAQAAARAALLPFVGRQWNKATRDAMQVALGQAATEAVPNLFGDVFGWVPGVAANLAVIAGIGVLGYIGLKTLAEGLGEG